MPETKGREYSLDFLKIVGTVLILLHHYQGTFGVHYGPVDFATGKFYFGNIVELFFMLSGYFASAYIERIYDGLSFKEYFLNRLIRLVPLMFISTFVWTVCYAVLWKGNGIELWKAVVTAFGVQSGGMFNETFTNSHFWFLSVLIICYAVFYLATKLSRNKGFDCRYAYLAMIILGTSAVSYGFNFPFLNVSAGRGYMAFFIGTLVALSLNGKTVTKGIAALCASIVAAGLLLIVFKWDWVSCGINYLLCFFFYPALIVLFKSPGIEKALKWRFLGTLAGISFNAYIWHLEFNFLSRALWETLGITINYESVLTEIINLIIEFGIGALSHYFIEIPVTAKLKKLIFAEYGDTLQ